MPPAAWLALIPVVAVERICFALGMIMVHQSVAYGILLLKKFFGAYAPRFKLGFNSGM
jgi:hypothetical protein